jgi:Na+:H+ antiporter, NhaB family
MDQARTLSGALVENFLGNSPQWYKLTIIAFLLVNPVLFVLSPFLAGWVLVLEFIFTLAMALRCYPLQPGGLLAIEAVAIGLTSPATVFHEAENNFEVILLLIFMVAGVFFLKDLLLFTFTKILISVRSKIALSLMFSFVAAFLSAFLDALTVTAVIITVIAGFYNVYHRVASGKQFHVIEHDASEDSQVVELHREDLARFRAFLRSLVMHAAIGTALGGVMTLVGEPQNLLIATVAGWEFIEFFLRMAPVTIPVFFAGITTVVLLEQFKLFGYGALLPDPVRLVLEDYSAVEAKKRTPRDVAALIVQACVAVFLVLGLAFHLAEVGIIGLSVIVLATAFTGITQESRLGHAFEEALPFTALLVVFFAIVAVIHDQDLFQPIIDWVLSLDPSVQPSVFFLANGLLSAISDNVFVATVYIGEVKAALDAGTITQEHFDLLTVAINTGTNIPSVATPNGQAAFLFLLTSALAPLIRLSYMRMVVMAFPYLITMTAVGLWAVIYML